MPNSIKFAFLNLKNHPRGNEILQCLIENKFVPEIVIEENSSLAIKNKKSLTSIIGKGPSTKQICKKNKIKIMEVKNHNNKTCEETLEKLNLDLIILGDTRILKKEIIDIPRIGIVNSHPGYLPDVRGNNPYIWALIYKLPQGCSVHFIDENIDTGDLLIREEIDIKACKSYRNLLEKINNLCAKLILKAIQQIANNNQNPIPQSQIKYKNPRQISMMFYSAPKEIKAIAKKILKKIIADTARH